MAGAKVYLIEHIYHTYNTEEIRRDSTISGSDGSYSFDFNLGEGYFTVYAYKQNYYPIHSNDSEVEIFDLGEEQKYNLALWPHAWLKVRFLNDSGAHGVYMNPLFGEPYGYEILNEADVTLTGLGVGNRENTIAYWIYPEREHHIDTVLPVGLDTLYHEIKY